MRKAGDVCFAEVSHDSEGLILIFDIVIITAIVFFFFSLYKFQLTSVPEISSH